MAKITIDGKECQFEGKQMIIQVANDNGVEIPQYCYHPGMSIVASCRICLAEVASPNPRNDNKVELIPKLVPTCQTPAADGMIVNTNSPKSIANQKAVMEYLLINHPLDCPVCDQAGECKLQDFSYQYGRAESRFEEDKIKQPKKDIGDHVYLYSDRCIMCSRCVRFTKEVTGTKEIGVFGRGSAEQIDVFPGKPLNNELSGNVVDICPVGALLDKDFLFTQRVWFLTKTPSIDGITASGDNIFIEHNEGKIYRVKPRTNLEVNKWWTSDEIRYGWKFVHSQDRLTKPQRLQFNTPVDADWKRVYAELVDNFKKTVDEKGPGSLAVLVSPMLTCEEAFLLGKFVRSLDEKAVLGVGPVPVEGEDKSFPGGYTIYAEKCPNSRGVRRALEAVAGDDTQVLDYDAFLAAVGDKAGNVGAALITGNYPSKWTTKELTVALSRKFTAVVDTLPNDLTGKADVLLASKTWAEKGGTFQNVQGKLQVFDPAVHNLIENARSEGQIAKDLLAAIGKGTSGAFDDLDVRKQMGDFMNDAVQLPSGGRHAAPDMQYVEL